VLFLRETILFFTLFAVGSVPIINSCLSADFIAKFERQWGELYLIS